MSNLSLSRSPHTAEVIRFAAGAGFRDLPAEVVRESKRCILDFLGVTIGAVDSEAGRIARDTALELGGAPQSGILGFGDRTSVANAALVNGILSHVLDFDDTHFPTILHPTGVVMSAGLPIGEWKAVSGRDLIAAHVVAFEVAARVSLALHPHHYDSGWHVTGTAGTLGAAVCAGRLMGLEGGQMAHALGMAATQASGQREQFGSMAKALHVGRAAAGGVLSALLASRGYTAAADSLEGRRGMFQVMGFGADSGELTRALGERWEILQSGLKPYPCGVVTHAAIDGVRRLRDRHRVCAVDIEKLDLRVHPLVLELTGKADPQTGLEGKFSVHFVCAVALLEGGVRPRHFRDETVRRPDLIELLGRIVPQADEGLKQTEAVLSAHLRDGRILTEHVKQASGTPENPLSQEELDEKFLDLVEPVMGRPAGLRLAGLVENLEELENVSELRGINHV
ncbi:MAG: MmgE/PrpD family protein [Acidobacteriota bacterium]